MDNSDSPNLQLLLKFDWEQHQTRFGDNIFHVIAKKGWLKMLYALEGFVDETVEPWLRERNKVGNTCLHEAARRNKGQQAIQIMEKLVEYGADLNFKSSCQKPVLHVAVEKEDHKLAAWICQQPGINLEAENSSKYTAYQLASKKWRIRDKKMMEILENHGAVTRENSDREDEKSDSEEEESDLEYGPYE
ncbi:uncharacterized protein LOC130663090 [Microplitis mediator]|uniref:uncharacterized protein LOC130663090 n=1 Tax=Microplitis mediator TaxID=375433 RepID=UPI0025537838|nr:uncharacterized protein LOC130663090 [Microplitis mediator]